MTTTRGIYFLANDKILELAIAFLNSFRKFNPDIALCLIPFDFDINAISKLNKIYDFSIFSKNEILKECDKISNNFHDKILGHYRKLAAWEGDFDQFIYIDTDTVVLSNFDFAFKFLSRFDFVTAYSECMREMVWNDSIYSTNILNQNQINFSANTGFFVSYKSSLPLTLVKKKLELGLTLSPHMALGCFEQPFLNYLFVTSGKYSSLSVQRKKNKEYWNFNIPLERWGGYSFFTLLLRKCEKIYWGIINFIKYRTFSIKDHILFIHWAGCWKAQRKDRKLKLFLELFGIQKELPTITFFMGSKIIWKYYRYLNRDANKIAKESKSN